MQTYPPGTRIGPYEIASRPMMGGMGVVYFSLDHGNNGRPVALKTFRPELLPDRAARDRFLREGTAWVELGSHPHIVRCYKVEYIDPTAFLVLELIAKEPNMPDASLRSWLIPGHPLPIEQALLFALQIARGMQHATGKIPGFVHRDLKPENILVGADKLLGTKINRLRVTDFGLAKTMAESGVRPSKSNVEELKPNQVQFTRGIGTPLYMAPEQWRGEQVGVFTDLYAFGCILYEMLSGRQAAEGRTITELQAAHCDGKIQSTAENLPKDVALLIANCLALIPNDRYESWEELRNKLETVYIMYTGQSAMQEVVSTNLSSDEAMQTGWSYNAMGVAYRDIGKAELATEYFKKALATARDIGDRLGEGNALGNLGWAHIWLGDPQRAIDSLEHALAILREIGDRRGEDAALNNLGNACFQLGDVRQAIRYHQQSLAIAREIGDRRGEGTALVSLGIAFAQLGEVGRGVMYFEQSLVIAREIGDRRGEGTALGNLGIAFAQLGEVRRGIMYFEQCLLVAREIGDRRGEVGILGNLGNVYANLGDDRQAIEHYEQQLVIMRDIGDRRGEGLALGNLGIAYKNLGEVRQAVDYYEQALAILRAISDTDGVARNSLNMALLYVDQGNTARALPLAQEAAQIWAKIGSPNVQSARQLVDQLQGGNSHVRRQSNMAQAAFDAFFLAASPQDIQTAVVEFPFMVEIDFIQAIEGFIGEQAQLEHKPAFEQRLTWLRQIADQT